MFLIPNGFNVDDLEPPPFFNSTGIRRSYGIPEKKMVILCLSAITTVHKRVDWIISEVSKLDNSCHLIMCVQKDSTTHIVENLAKSKLESYTIMTLPSAEVKYLIWASDIMVLGSLSEGFPRVVGEAMASLTPIIVHPHVNMEWILGKDSQSFADMTNPGELSGMISDWKKGKLLNEEQIILNSKRIRRYFSRSAVVPQYLSMFDSVFSSIL